MEQFTEIMEGVRYLLLRNGNSCGIYPILSEPEALEFSAALIYQGSDAAFNCWTESGFDGCPPLSETETGFP